MKIVVIAPDHNEGEHELDNPFCHCKPDVEWHNGTPMISHNSICECHKWYVIEMTTHKQLCQA